LLINGVKLLQSAVKGYSLVDCIDWTPSEKNRFVVIDKQSGKVLKTKYYSEDSFFMFHHINAYEEGDRLVVDITMYPSPAVLFKFTIHSLRKPGDTYLQDISQAARFIIPVVHNIKNVESGVNLSCDSEATAERHGDIIILKPKLLAPPGFEFATINTRFSSKCYNHMYVTGVYDYNHYMNALSKIDVRTGINLNWSDNEWCYPGEPCFVADPSADPDDEDAGILISAVTDAREDHPDYMVILDAKTMNEVARAEVDAHVPQGLHGLFKS